MLVMSRIEKALEESIAPLQHLSQRRAATCLDCTGSMRPLYCESRSLMEAVRADLQAIKGEDQVYDWDDEAVVCLS